MIIKILFTITVILSGFAFIKFRQRRQLLITEPAEPSPLTQAFKIVALVIAILMSIAVAFMLWDQWRDRTISVLIEVVNVNNQQTTEYRAFKKDINQRSFITLDGRQIILAPIERMEIIRAE